jgi:hypothetical protein
LFSHSLSEAAELGKYDESSKSEFRQPGIRNESKETIAQYAEYEETFLFRVLREDCGSDASAEGAEEGWTRKSRVYGRTASFWWKDLSSGLVDLIRKKPRCSLIHEPE